VIENFWAWEYYWEYQCPRCENWHPALDYLEYTSEHPYIQRPEWEKEKMGLSTESFIDRSQTTESLIATIEEDAITDEEIGASWDTKVEDWDKRYDEYGDRNRKYQSDPVLFKFLPSPTRRGAGGEVEGLTILDAGCGAGYLCRLLAKWGAKMVGVENSRRFYEMALEYERKEPLGIIYHHGTISSMPYLQDESFDAIVSNYVLMDCRDYKGAVKEFARALKQGGIAVVVISHPCFNTTPVSGGHKWIKIPLDTQRREERTGWVVDNYFLRCCFEESWGNFKTPFISFHRPLTDYYQTFRENGFSVTDLEEPSVSEWGMQELPAHLVKYMLRIPWSIAFRLRKEN
jgi:ubiquinone/menaquinone biosynthesis C-methylase UbiE